MESNFSVELRSASEESECRIGPLGHTDDVEVCRIRIVEDEIDVRWQVVVYVVVDTVVKFCQGLPTGQ